MSSFFILGMRRSGTSILRKLIMQHPQVKNIAFEPNELFEVTERIGIQRYANNLYFQQVFNTYKTANAKLVTNAGIEGMRWLNFPYYYQNKKFIFIIRNPESTYKSWVRVETSRRGNCSYEMYLPWYEHIVDSFREFAYRNPNRATVMIYKYLLKDVDKELEKVWNLLGLEKMTGFQSQIRKPNN